jgi:hypothetical protein
MDTSNFKEDPKKQEDAARRKIVKGEQSRSGNSSTDSNSGSGTDYQIYIPLGCSTW